MAQVPNPVSARGEPLVKLSVCVPTHNRARHLANCLNSLAGSVVPQADFEVCISDNASPDGTPEVVEAMRGRLNLRYRRQVSNVGIARNFLDVVAMAEGEFAWLLGDDDLLYPHAIARVLELITANPGIDFFYVNSSLLNSDYVFAQPQPFDLAQLPPRLPRFSSWPETGPMPFLDLVRPEVSFDFLMGMYLAVFRRAKWQAHAGALDPAALTDPRTFSYFDNTCPHLRIFARAFASSQAWFEAEPLSISLAGAREWAPKYPLVRSVRMPEALEEFRRNGLPLGRYLRCRNHALASFLPDLAYMRLHREHSGYNYIQPLSLTLRNLPYPNTSLSVLYYVGRKVKALFS